MGRTDLPAMYARARGYAVHEPEGIQWPRASADISGKSDHTCYICYVTLLALQKSAKLAIYCNVSLYNDRFCLRLWVFNSNVSMMFSKINRVIQ